MAYEMKGYSYAGKSPLKQVHTKKSTESAHGQLGDAEQEYQNDLKATYNTSVKEHAKENPYWYKVNGNKVSKYVYNKYENKPGSDEIGKQTNDPDASGNKAKIEKDRANNEASKKPPLNYKKTPVDFKSPVKQSIQDSTVRHNIRTDIKIERKLTDKEKEIQAANKTIQDSSKKKSVVYDKNKKNLAFLAQKNPIATLFTGR